MRINLVIKAKTLTQQDLGWSYMLRLCLSFTITPMALALFFTTLFSAGKAAA